MNIKIVMFCQYSVPGFKPVQSVLYLCGVPATAATERPPLRDNVRSVQFHIEKHFRSPLGNTNSNTARQ